MYRNEENSDNPDARIRLLQGHHHVPMVVLASRQKSVVALVDLRYERPGSDRLDGQNYRR
jgi:hypothetical protein